MKMRYYLRGLGLGILVTAIFFLVGDSSGKTMSDEQIKARAKELGMIESTVLAEIPKEEMTESAEEENSVESVMESETESAAVETVVEETESVEESSIEETTEEIGTEAEEETATEETVEESKTEDKNIEETSEPEESSVAEEPVSTAGNTESVSIVVHSGEGSDDVSRRLADMGLVADAHEYDKYLMANGYDKKIRTGEHIIPAGATWEEMAKILCNRN